MFSVVSHCSPSLANGTPFLAIELNSSAGQGALGGHGDPTDGAKLISIVRDLAIVATDRAYKTLHRPDLVQEKLAGDP
jgi:hypothetical protein